MSQRVVTVNEVLDGHVALDIQCPDRIYLNAYVPKLQTSAQVVAFLSEHLGYPFPSPALFRKIGERVPQGGGRLRRGQPHPGGAIRQGRRRQQARRDAPLPGSAGQRPDGPGWPRSGWRRSSSGCGPPTNAKPQPGHRGGAFTKADRRVTCYYFYLLGPGLRSGVRQGLRLLPLPGQDLDQRPRVGQTAGRQRRHRVHRAVQRVRRLRRPACAAGDLRPAGAGRDQRVRRNAGWRCCRCRSPTPTATPATGGRLSMRQVEISRTIVFDAPRHARGFFEALVADNLDIGRPHNVEIIFDRRIRRDTPRHLPHRDRPPRQRRRGGQRLLQALPRSSSTSRTGGRCGSRP